MESSMIYQNDGKGILLAFEGGEVEKINPIAYYSDWFIKRDMALSKVFLQMNNRFMESLLTEDYYINRALENWAKLEAEINNIDPPKELLQVLEADSKKDQERILRGVGFNYKEFASFLFTAYKKYDFTFSNYKSEQLPKNITEDEMPLFTRLKDDGSVQTLGNTNLSKGQLKSAIQFRRVVVAKILDRGSEWHCFFTVYRSLKGEESWQNGQPHFHYISDKWGHTREEVVAMFKGDRYPTTSVHIAYNE